MGNWLGRAGRGWQGWLTYSFSPVTRLQFGYRLQEISRQFLQGGRSQDCSLAADVAISPRVSLRGFLQYESWKFPLLASTPQSDLSASFQLSFYPNLRVRK